MKYVVAYAKSTWDRALSQKEKETGYEDKSLEAMPPFGAVVAGNVLKKKLGNDFLGVIDAYSIDEGLEEKLDNICNDNEDITLFFSVYAFNNDSSLEIVESLKKRHKTLKVVFGGPFAEYFENNENIDSIIIGNAESGLEEYLNKKEKRIKSKKVTSKDFQINDFSIINKDSEYSQGVINSIRGCKYRSKDKGCSFCSLKEYSLRIRKPRDILIELYNESNELNVDWFYDGSDSFAISKKWLREFAGTRQQMIDEGYNNLKDLNIYTYVNASDINDKEIVDLLYECGVRRIFMGFESGDDDILQKDIHKPGASVESNLKSLEMFKGSKIERRLGIVLGVGETEESLKNTYHFLSKIKDYDIDSIVLSPVLVMPGSELYDNMVSNKYGFPYEDMEKVREIDDKLKQGRGITKKSIDYLSKKLIGYSGEVSYTQLIAWKDKMDKYVVDHKIGLWTFDGVKK